MKFSALWMVTKFCYKAKYIWTSCFVFNYCSSKLIKSHRVLDFPVYFCCFILSVPTPAVTQGKGPFSLKFLLLESPLISWKLWKINPLHVYYSLLSLKSNNLQKYWDIMVIPQASTYWGKADRSLWLGLFEWKGCHCLHWGWPWSARRLSSVEACQEF